jgi:hypothetical protein
MMTVKIEILFQFRKNSLPSLSHNLPIFECTKNNQLKLIIMGIFAAIDPKC